MGLQGIDYQTLNVPFSAGLNTKGDKRAKQPPMLDICDDAQFDNVGGLETRKPFAADGNNIFGGGTLSNCRRFFANGDELLCFTVDSLYSWSSQLSVWVKKATHLAAKITETTTLATNDDQIDSDRAELNGTIVYTWSVQTSLVNKVYVAAMDKATGAILVAPTDLGSTSCRPRLVALSTKILLFFSTTSLANTLEVFAIDPASPSAFLLGSSTTVIPAVHGFALPYDVTRVIGQDQAILVTQKPVNTSYVVCTITSGLTVVSSTKGRTCDGPIAVSVDPTGTQAQIIRANGLNIQGDLITISTLADVYTAQAIGTFLTSCTQIAAAHRSVQNSGQYRCYVFWSTEEGLSAPNGERIKTNWVSTGNTLGAESMFQPWLGVASRAFDYNGSVYFWSVFARSSAHNVIGFAAGLQNTYFLFRDDGTLVAKSCPGNAGGFAPTAGHLSGVALTVGTTGFTCSLGIRRKVTLSRLTIGYAERAPRDVTVAFDSNDARRCARLGPTLYIAGGGELLQYDGLSITEVGFHLCPWDIFPIDAGPSVGGLGAGTYAYKNTFHSLNGNGETDRSTSITIAQVTVAAAHDVSISEDALWVTHKTSNPSSIETWRTAASGTDISPFDLVSSNDPTALTNPNRYTSNSLSASTVAALTDHLPDPLTTEANPEAVGVLEKTSPPAATMIIATEDRLFISGIPGFPNRVQYSKQRVDGEVAAFNDQLTIDVPIVGGKITALAFLDGALVVFRETATYVFSGAGFDNTGLGQNYALARTASQKLGAVSMEAVALEDRGLIVKTGEGWKILTQAWTYEDIGLPVSLYDTDTVVAVHVMPDRHQIRVLTTARMLILDTLVNQWGRWTISDGIHAAIWNGVYRYLTATGPKSEQTTYTSLTYGWDVETVWIKPGELQGRMIVLWFQLLAEFRSACHIRVRVARNYQSDGAGGWLYDDDVKVPAAPTVVGGPLQLRHGPSKKRCEAIKVRLTALAVDDVNPPSGEAAKLTGLAFRYGVEPGLFSGLAAAQTK